MALSQAVRLSQVTPEAGTWIPGLFTAVIQK